MGKEQVVGRHNHTISGVPLEKIIGGNGEEACVYLITGRGNIRISEHVRAEHSDGASSIRVAIINTQDPKIKKLIISSDGVAYIPFDTSACQNPTTDEFPFSNS